MRTASLSGHETLAARMSGCSLGEVCRHLHQFNDGLEGDNLWAAYDYLLFDICLNFFFWMVGWAIALGNDGEVCLEAAPRSTSVQALQATQGAGQRSFSLYAVRHLLGGHHRGDAESFTAHTLRTRPSPCS